MGLPPKDAGGSDEERQHTEECHCRHVPSIEVESEAQFPQRPCIFLSELKGDAVARKAGGLHLAKQYRNASEEYQENQDDEGDPNGSGYEQPAPVQTRS